MTLRYFLSFVGTAKPDQAIDPATFPIVLRVQHVHPSDDEEVMFWTATNENGRGTVTDSSATVYTAQTLDEVVQRLATAGFRHVRIDMAGAPVAVHPPLEDEDCPF